MKISELKKLIENVPDDFEFEVNIRKQIPSERLKTMSYQYPWDTERLKTDAKDYDIGWSEKKMNIGAEVREL